MKTYGYGKQNITEDDINAVVEVLKSPYLTCGPKVKEFEQMICDYTGAKYCVAVNSAIWKKFQKLQKNIIFLLLKTDICSMIGDMECGNWDIITE